MQGEACPTRVVTTRCVDEEHVRPFTERTNGRLEERPFSQREQAGLVAGCRRAGRGRSRNYAPTLNDRGARPRGLTFPSSTARSTLEADEARSDRKPFSGRLPRRRRRVREQVLFTDERLRGFGPVGQSEPRCRYADVRRSRTR